MQYMYMYIHTSEDMIIGTVLNLVVPFSTPNRWWQVPYFWMGLKAYDVIAGRQLVKSSYYVSKSKALEEFPMLKEEKLCGAIVYYDGQ